MPRIEVVTIEDLKNSGKPATGYMWLENRFDGSVNVFWCDFVPRECQSCKLVKVLDSKESDYGFNALTGEFGSMTKMGVVDPVIVTIQALLNAASVAKTVITTECLVTDIPEEKKEMPQMAMGGMDY